MSVNADMPSDLDLKKDTALTVRWSDGTRSVYPIAYLRKMSPSADMRELRKSMKTNPLTILPSSGGVSGVSATTAELVGNYAIRIEFSDGHKTGIYTWAYLREIDPDRQTDGGLTPSDRGPAHNNPLGLPTER